jgi:hypothetical protein
VESLHGSNYPPRGFPASTEAMEEFLPMTCEQEGFVGYFRTKESKENMYLLQSSTSTRCMSTPSI